MTKEKLKAKELFDKYFQLAESIEWTDDETSVKAEKFNNELGSDVLKYWHELAKKSALICVDEILNAIDWHEYEHPNDIVNYWFEVKKEIENL
jgi:hypothetical protein